MSQVVNGMDRGYLEQHILGGMLQPMNCFARC